MVAFVLIVLIAFLKCRSLYHSMLLFESISSNFCSDFIEIQDLLLKLIRS